MIDVRNHNLQGYPRALCDGSSDEVAIQVLADYTYSLNEVLWFPAGIYLVDKVRVNAGLTVRGESQETAIIKRFNPSPPPKTMWRLFYNLQSYATDSPLLSISNLTFDDSGQNTIEQASGGFFGGRPEKPGRLNVLIEDCTFRNNKRSDGLGLYTNVNATIQRCKFHNCWRGGLSWTGGNSTLILTDLTVTRDANFLGVGSKGTGFHQEMEKPGFGNNFDCNILANRLQTNCGYCQQSAVLSASVVRVNNLKITGGSTTLCGSQHGKNLYQDCDIETQKASGSTGYLNNPGADFKFINCNFRAVASDIDSPTVSRWCSPTYSPSRRGVQAHQRLVYDSCYFGESEIKPPAGNVKLYGVGLATLDPPSNDNQVKFISCTTSRRVSALYGFGKYGKGGNWEVV